ncbi:NADPH:quinone oxidoreductase family protein [Streptomyces sp. NPDC098781]|uniref:NADPH:quinone oxidoreductase family protein n=1 Tax=Streptomyces sp. NPDC098781 TaxID=3366097 RepID=UPI00382D91F6
MLAAQILQYGEPVNLVIKEVPPPAPANGYEVVDVEAAGVNFHDVNVAANSFGQNTPLPHVPGAEVLGRLANGSRVVAFCRTDGGFCERIAVPAKDVFPVPDEVGDLEALAMVVQGNTAWHVLHTMGHLGSGETVLVHAGAGGVGSLAVQLARLAGARTVIATASTAEKRDLAKELGADAVLDSDDGDLVEAIAELTAGQGVDLALESVGGAAFGASLRALAPLGRLVTFGVSGRTPPPLVNPRDLTRRNVTVAGFYLGSFPDLGQSTAMLMSLLARGQLRVLGGGSYPLERSSEALNALSSRRTSGKLVIRVASPPPADPTTH